jgi:cytochrome P450
MALAGPQPVETNPLRRIVSDVRCERAATVPYPPGPTRFDPVLSHRMQQNPLEVLLELYDAHGPVFSTRILHNRMVWMLGPEANHHILVSNAQNFSWRGGLLGDLAPAIGDGLLTTDGEYHDRARKTMVPAFHSERLEGMQAGMLSEIDAAVEELRDGEEIDLYAWTRRLALRVAVQALFGFDPDKSYARMDLAQAFEDVLHIYSRDYVVQMLRGPRTPWARMRAARRRLDALMLDEIADRRRTGRRGPDILSMLLDAGELTDEQIRDQMMTLLFAGHDTTTPTVAFLFYELARAPQERDALLTEARTTPFGADMPALERAIDETLRLYPPAWIGPRRSIEPFEFAGHTIPGGVPVDYCSWASHRLPDVWERAHDFVPGRWTAQMRAALPKGAYVPFGAGQRICIGMRFGQLEVRAISARLLARCELDLQPGYRMRIRMMPTLSPRDGLPVTVRLRADQPVREGVAHELGTG